MVPGPGQDVGHGLGAFAAPLVRVLGPDVALGAGPDDVHALGHVPEVGGVLVANLVQELLEQVDVEDGTWWRGLSFSWLPCHTNVATAAFLMRVFLLWTSSKDSAEFEAWLRFPVPSCEARPVISGDSTPSTSWCWR